MRSNRVPWLRGSLLSFVPVVLPLVWVVEVDSCGSSPKSTELTGLELVKKFDLEAWAVVVPAVLIAISAPFVARASSGLGQRMAVHVVGLLATGFSGYAALMVMTFTIFSERVFRAPGAAVMTAFIASFGDALWRLGWSIREWRTASRPRRGEG